jgi:hypothetical protein
VEALVILFGVVLDIEVPPATAPHRVVVILVPVVLVH